MNRRQRNAMLLLRDASAQGERRSCDDGVRAARELRREVVHRSEVARGPGEDRLRAAQGIPQLGTGCEGAVLLGGADGDELQVRVIDQRLEVVVGRDRDVVAALLEADADADKGM